MPVFFARAYRSVDLARRALQRINDKLSANTGAYCASVLDGDTPVVAAVTLTGRGRRRLQSAAWGGENYELPDELREQLLARLAHLQGQANAGTLPAEGYVRRGGGAGVEVQPDGSAAPVNRPQG